MFHDLTLLFMFSKDKYPLKKIDRNRDAIKRTI